MRYVVHELTLSNRSVTDRANREQVFLLLGESANVMDPTSSADLQVVTIRVTLNAAAGSLEDVAAKATATGATWETRDEDF